MNTMQSGGTWYEHLICRVCGAEHWVPVTTVQLLCHHCGYRPR
jgi:ribosomal protein L37E